MKALLYHARRYQTKVVSLSDRPVVITPESVVQPTLNQDDCIAAFITVEKTDAAAANAIAIAQAIIDFAKETGVRSAVILPFAHLSSKLAPSEVAMRVLQVITELLQKELSTVLKDHFGSNKELLLDIYGHPGAVRFREV